MRTRALVAVGSIVALLCALSWPYRARADAPPPDPTLEQAKQHFDAGHAAYEAGDYQTAIREFKAAQALRPAPVLDYNIGLAHERLDHPRVAMKFFQRYLQGRPDAPNRAEVEGRIRALEQRLAVASVRETAPNPPQPDPSMEPVEPAPPVAPTTANDPYVQQAPAQPPPAPAQPVKRSLWWVPLVAVGGALLLTGIILLAIYAPGNSSNGAVDRSSGALTLIRF